MPKTKLPDRGKPTPGPWEEARTINGKDKKLIVEYHYKSGGSLTTGAHHDRTRCFCASTLWEFFGKDHDPSHITISMEEKDEK